ncbi:MAG: hypothetical protein IT559_03230 [Alphaproteobacteria bacterium]|nr:hypothetical protein [Alphaproteobacteria bacterium]
MHNDYKALPKLTPMMTAQAKGTSSMNSTKNGSLDINKVIAEFEKEAAPPALGENIVVDLAFLERYFIYKTNNSLGGFHPDASVHGPLDPDESVQDTFSALGIRDERPGYRITLHANEEHLGQLEKFCEEQLEQTFTAPGAVKLSADGLNEDNTTTIVIRGNPSRLVWDAITNDPKLAESIVKEIGHSIPKQIPPSYEVKKRSEASASKWTP